MERSLGTPPVGGSVAWGNPERASDGRGDRETKCSGGAASITSKRRFPPSGAEPKGGVPKRSGAEGDRNQAGLVQGGRADPASWEPVRELFSVVLAGALRVRLFCSPPFQP